MSSSVSDTLARRISIAFVIACSALGARGSQNDSARPVQFSRLANAPLYFESNAGQVEGSAQFVARGNDCTVLLAPTEAEILLGKSSSGTAAASRVVRLELVGANASASIAGCEQISAHANYFIGNDPGQWHSGVPLFSKARVDKAYPGVQVIYYANQSAQLEYDFLLQAGAAAEQICFRISGADSVQVDGAGNLVLKIGREEIRQHKPVAYQEKNGARTEVAAGYRLNQNGTVGFTLGQYDRALPLTIDPVLDFLTYLGGKKMELGHGITRDGAGNIYVVGETLSTDLGATNLVVDATNTLAFTNGVYSGTNFLKFRGGNNSFGDAFVAKYNDSGALQFVTYLGGKTDDGAYGITYDASSDAIWVAGFTDSTNFPLVNPIRSKITGLTKNALHTPPTDGFITKIDPTGTTLLFSTYFGGDSIDEATAIAVDPAGSIYVTGLTSSTNLPIVPPNAYQTKIAGQFDSFIAKFSGGGSAYTIEYSTYLGGTNADYGLSIAVDSARDAWVTGLTLSTNFPMAAPLQLPADPNNFFYTNGYTFTNLDTIANGTKRNVNSIKGDAFVSELDPTGTLLPFSSYLGGSNEDAGQQITIDAADNVYVTGFTFSRNFPTNQSTLTPTNGLPEVPNEIGIVFPSPGTNFISHVFVTKIAGHALDRSTAFGGNLVDTGSGIAVDNNGLVYVTGSVGSTNFFQKPMLATNAVVDKHGRTNYFGFVTNSPVFTDLGSTNVTVKFHHGGNSNDVFVVVLTPDLGSFTNTIALGGPGRDDAEGITITPDGHTVYLVGTTTSSTNFTKNPAQPLYGKTGKNSRLSDAFVGKIEVVPAP